MTAAKSQRTAFDLNSTVESWELLESSWDFLYPRELSGSLAFSLDTILSAHRFLLDCSELSLVVGCPLGHPQLGAHSHPARSKLALALFHLHPKGLAG